MKKRNLLLIVLALLLALLSACDAAESIGTEDQITASGTISAIEVNISPEIGGKVEEVYVLEGQQVLQGEPLFKVEDTLLLGQQDQAQAALDLAQASLDAADAQLSAAQIQYQIALQGSRLQEAEARLAAWQTPQAGEIDTPVWYFNKAEQIAALQAEVDTAAEDYEIRLANLDDVLADATNEDFVEVELRVVEAQAAFTIAMQTLQQAAAVDDDLEDAAQRDYDAALSELEAAQTEYNRLLTTSAAEEVLQARAQAAVAQARLENAQDALALLLSGEESLQVEAAAASVTMAETARSQAEANLAQAQAALDLIALQVEKTLVTAPISGVILALDLNRGELVGAGVVTMTIAQLDSVTLTVYIVEDEYGKINLGDEALVSVDSFPDKTYTAFVTSISDQAEFTPRNVQTSESRTSTVYAVELSLGNPQLELKPGMPADVIFSTD